ncbi:hypothetical protein FNJ84_21220 [Paracoccus sp. M683]|uniref:hypothetical protein n=1 Tax=Paracoccus sp. M683 TaxID=2594268 RepID=UPI00117E4DE0|nr:hypothetical protein [Paracoccus sp. M683]TRW92128.1 hypothetical protein FNJ84_21220 [Paracoccus sp. M683]
MGKYDKIRAATLVSLAADLKKAGFKFSFQKYPNMRNKYEIAIEGPPGTKANFRTVVGSNEEMLKINDAIQTGGAKLLFNLSGAVGRFGEDAVLRALRSGKVPSKKFTVTKGGQSLEFDMKDMTFGDALQIQNRSGHGLDAVVPIIAPRPPAPHHVVIEVKSRMGRDLPFPPLSEAQKGDSYLEDQIDTVERGIRRARQARNSGQKTGRTWEDMIDHREAIDGLKTSLEQNSVTKLLAKVELDQSGNQSGEIILEIWQ